MKENKTKPNYAKVSIVSFSASAIACVLFFGPMIIFSDAAQQYVDIGIHAITYTTDWLWEIVVFACFIFAIWLAFGRFGKVRLGGPEDKPDFSTFTWIAMMFCSSTGGALVYWATVEPMYYMMHPPFWIEPLTAQSAQYALTYGFFHWGVSAWATFAVPAVVFGYLYYVRKKPYLTPSYAIGTLLGKKVSHGWIGKVIDAVIAFGLVGGMATALGFIIPMTSNLFSDYAGIPDTLLLQIGFCLLFALIFGWSAYRGLKGGIAKLADFNMWIAFALLGFVFVVGNPSFYLSLFSDSFGVFLNEFLRMSFYTDPISSSGFPQDWTVFYWAWWLAWAVFVGLFTAKISKGRTIRSVILTMIISGTLASMIYFTIFGGYVVDAVLNKGIDLMTIMTSDGGPALVTWFMNSLPASVIVVPAIIFYLVVATATGTDSAAFTLALMTCKEVEQDMEPPKWNRVFWAFMIFIGSVALMLVGGMEVVKLASVLTAIPVLPLIVLLGIALVKWLREDFGRIADLTTDKYDATPD
jgi:BCCT family betaine/carnitine transporter